MERIPLLINSHISLLFIYENTKMHSTYDSYVNARDGVMSWENDRQQATLIAIHSHRRFGGWGGARRLSVLYPIHFLRVNLQRIHEAQVHRDVKYSTVHTTAFMGTDLPCNYVRLGT